MRLSTKYIAAAVMAVALPIASMSAPAAGAQPTSEKQATQQSQISKPSTTTSQSKTDRKNNGQQEVDPLLRIRETWTAYGVRSMTSKRQRM